MHREYHPDDIHHLRVHAFDDRVEDHAGHAHPHHRDRSLYVLTAVLGLLIAGDVVFGALGWETYRAPYGVSLAFLAAILGAARIVYGALEALFAGRIGADIALAQACLAAIIIGEYFVAAEVVFIALVGEVLEAITFARTQREIHRLIDQTPRTARVRRDGVELVIPAGQVEPGDLVLVGPGERVPVDGPVVAGRSSVDQSALTGESAPIDKGIGDAVYTGTVNQFGLLEVRAEKVGHETTFGQVLRLVGEAQRRKAPLERTADRLARYFLPVVEAVAILTLVLGYALGWPDVWFRTVAVLVVACPCALVLATPAAVLASMAWLARHGVLIKGGVGLERLASCDTFAFDKTGTLTYGRPELAGIVPLDGWSEDEVLRRAATAEATSSHPLASVILRTAAQRGLTPYETSDVVALPGAGVSALCPVQDDDAHHQMILVGNRRLLTEHGVALDEAAESALQALDARGETPLLVAVDGRVVGLIGARDTVRPEAHDVIHELKHLGISEIAILTGDRPNAAKAVAKKVHVKTVEAELLPADKAAWIQERQEAGRKVAMVGDGINDAPALAAAKAGIALGGVGTDLAAEAGDLVVMGDPLRVLPDLVKLARSTVAIIRQNIIGFAFGLNGVAMTAAVLGILGPVPAAILHQAGSLLVLLNAMRLLWFGDWKELPPVRWVRAAGQTIRRFDERFDTALALESVMTRWRALVVVAALATLGACATSGWTVISPAEVGLLQRQGRYLGVLEPGLHLRWPAPFERVTRVQPDQVRGVEIGFRSEGRPTGDDGWGSSAVVARHEEEALLLTGEGQLVELSATVQYRLDPDPERLRAVVFGVADPEAALRPLAESVVRGVVSQSSLGELLTSHRRQVEQEASVLLQRRVDAYGLGLVIAAVAFQDVHPPPAVRDAFRDVSRAESERQRRLNEGETYRAEQITTAQGQAAATVHQAEADRRSRVAQARGESDAFRYRLDARAAYPDLTDHWLYWDAVAGVLSQRPKVILDPSQANQRRHLILPDVPLGEAPALGESAIPTVSPPRSPDRNDSNPVD